MSDTALYIMHNGRGWCVWHSPNNELIAIPEDEKPYGNKELHTLSEYLQAEGFFQDYFSIADLD